MEKNEFSETPHVLLRNVRTSHDQALPIGIVATDICYTFDRLPL